MSVGDAAPESQVSPRSGLGRWIKIPRRVLVVLVVVAVALLVVVVLYRLTAGPVIERSLARDVPFTVYSPTSDPDGYALDRSRVNSTSSTFSYIFNHVEDGSTLTVTIQPRPDSFDMTSLSEGGSINSTVTKNGTVYNLSAANSHQYLLDTGSSLVFFRSTRAIDAITVNGLADSLVKIN